MLNPDDPPEPNPDARLRQYSLGLAALAVDSLVDAGLVEKANFGKAKDVAADELYVRFAMGDLPPQDAGPKTDRAP